MNDTDRHSPMVGMVVTISPSLSLYRMVVLPAASRPTEDKEHCSIDSHHQQDLIQRHLPMRILICFLPKSLEKTLLMVRPMLVLMEEEEEVSAAADAVAKEEEKLSDVTVVESCNKHLFSAGVSFTYGT